MTEYETKRLAALARKFAKTGVHDRDARRTAETILPVLRQAVMKSVPEFSVITADTIANQMIFTAALYIAANRQM
ncbi:MAG: hypothetical protein IJJ20_03435 [Thermoguttaceae bacterium]|nr:hypothetical protein [Thermoguttaceae bacterium]